jgi:sugar/nucleoside kinase (ribokinase family)
VTDLSFVAVGDVMLDVTASGEGHAASVDVTAGGSAVNAGLWAAAAGVDATVFGRVGDDLAGRAVRAALEEQGVHARLSTDPEARTGTFLVVDGEIRADRGANGRFDREHLPHALRADVVLLSGYLPAATVAAAAELADATWVALAPGLLEPLPEGVDAVLVDEIEAQRLTGAEPEAAARALSTSFRLVCVTRGALGAVAVLDGRLEEAVAEPVEATRPVGAGDAFAACLLLALAHREDLGEALAAACRVGARIAAGVAP